MPNGTKGTFEPSVVWPLVSDHLHSIHETNDWGIT